MKKYLLQFSFVAYILMMCFYSTSQPFNIHLNNSPETLGWRHGCIQTSDSGFLIAAEERLFDTHISLTKYDANFKNLLWKKRIENKPSKYIQISEIRETKDKGYILYGYSSQIDNCDPIFIKFNACGEKEWVCIYHDSNYFVNGVNYTSSIIPLDNGGYMAFSSGHLERYEISASTVFIIDSTMNLVDDYSFWLTDFGRLKKHENNIYIASRMYIADIDSNSNPSDTERLISRLAPISFNSDGNIKWYKPLVSIENKITYMSDLVKSKDGYLYVLGVDYNFNDSIIRMLYKYDTLGNFINSKPFGHTWRLPYWINIQSIEETDDGGFIVTSIENKTPASKSLSRIEKIDKKGNVLDSLIFGDKDSVENYVPRHLQRTYDGNYIVLMNVSSNGGLIGHTYVVKVDQNLKIVNMDTVTQFHYDSYCNHTPTSDTIYLDASNITEKEFKADSSMVYRYVFKKTGIANQISPKRMWLNSYPNPATDYININLKDIGVYTQMEIEIFDMQGKKINVYTITKGTETYNIPLYNFAKGSYIIQIKSEGKLLAGNIVMVQ